MKSRRWYSCDGTISLGNMAWSRICKRVKKTLRRGGQSALFEAVFLAIAEFFYMKLWVTSPMETFTGNAKEILSETLERFGVEPGDTVLVHSAWDSLRFAFASPKEVLDSLLDHIGPNGTLVMPAIPMLEIEDGVLFDVDRTPSRAGLLSEYFRRQPGVQRSISINHSVCAIGPNALYLTSDHHLGLTSWDEYSPYRRLAEIPRAWVIGLGVGRALRAATSTHCVDSELVRHPYFQKLFRNTVTYRYRSIRSGEGEVSQLVRRGVNYGPRLARHFTSEELKEITVCGIDFYAIRSDTLVNKSIRLALEGKTMYLWPIPWFWYFHKRGSPAIVIRFRFRTSPRLESLEKPSPRETE